VCVVGRDGWMDGRGVFVMALALVWLAVFSCLSVSSCFALLPSAAIFFRCSVALLFSALRSLDF
jgi:hypothetical protein